MILLYNNIIKTISAGRGKGMDFYYLWKKATDNIVTIHTSVITKDGVLTLPKECLAGRCVEDDGYPIILTNSLAEGVLCIYSYAAFDEIHENLRRLNYMDSNVRYLVRRILGEAIETLIDKSGNIKIEAELLSRLGFDTDQSPNDDKTKFPVTLLVYPNKIEIVSSTLYEEIKAELN